MENISYKKLFSLWLPLAVTWIMISAEGPFLAAVVARQVAAKYNLAAYGIAVALALLTESIVIMLLSTANFYVRSRAHYFIIRKFTITVNIIAFSFLVIIILPPVFNIFSHLMRLDEKVKELAHISTVILLPWPVAIGFRRFYQGILIRKGHTIRVAISTVFRMFTIFTTALTLSHFTHIQGAIIGAISLSTGVTLEAILAKIITNSTVKNILKDTSQNIKVPDFAEILKFYIPLALTAMLGMASQTTITFFLGRAALPLESLAVMPVVGSFSFIFASVCFAYMEIVIANCGTNFENYKKLINFAILIGFTVMFIYIAAGNTPFANFWFAYVAGLSNSTLNLSGLAIEATKILFIMPLFAAITSLQRGLLILFKKSIQISFATFLELFLIIITLNIIIYYVKIPGIYAACFSLIIARGLACIYLSFPINHSIRLIKNKS